MKFIDGYILSKGTKRELNKRLKSMLSKHKGRLKEIHIYTYNNSKKVHSIIGLGESNE